MFLRESSTLSLWHLCTFPVHIHMPPAPRLPPYTFHFVSIPPCGNSVCILSISPGQSETFKLSPSFNRSILALSYLKIEAYAQAQITVIFYYILFTSFLIWYDFHLAKWSWSIILSTWARDFIYVSWSVNYALSFCQICYFQKSASQLYGKILTFLLGKLKAL